LKSLVDELRSLSTSLVLQADLGGAKLPSLNLSRDVEGSSNIGTSIVINNRVTESARREQVSLRGVLRKERSVVSGGVLLVGSAVGRVHLRVGLGTVADSEDIIDVNISDKLVEVAEEGLAFSGCVHGHTTVIAVVGDHFVVHVGIVK
jgi:hypothetical protein